MHFHNFCVVCLFPVVGHHGQVERRRAAQALAVDSSFNLVFFFNEFIHQNCVIRQENYGDAFYFNNFLY